MCLAIPGRIIEIKSDITLTDYGPKKDKQK